jgi:hypothetical protein
MNLAELNLAVSEEDKSRPVEAFTETVRLRSGSSQVYCVGVSDSLDLDAFLERFRERAKAVRNRPMPPVEGPERVRFKERMQVDFMDYAMLGDAKADLVDGILTLTIDLRPPAE